MNNMLTLQMYMQKKKKIQHIINSAKLSFFFFYFVYDPFYSHLNNTYKLSFLAPEESDAVRVWVSSRKTLRRIFHEDKTCTLNFSSLGK